MDGIAEKKVVASKGEIGITEAKKVVANELLMPKHYDILQRHLDNKAFVDKPGVENTS